MLTFYRRPGVPGPPIPRLLVTFFRFFFPIRPTEPISGNAFDAKRKKRGWPYLGIEFCILSNIEF